MKNKNQGPGELADALLPEIARLPISSRANLVLIGQSIGAIVAIEVARRLPVAGLVIISAISDYRQMPLFYRMAGRLGLTRMVSIPLLRKLQPILYLRWPGKKGAAERIKYNRMLKSGRSDLLWWGQHQLARWRGKAPAGIPSLRIHGAADKVFPPGGIGPRDTFIEGAGHFLLPAHANTVIAAIRQFAAWLPEA